jgi:nucleoid-associated protein YgaU
MSADKPDFSDVRGGSSSSARPPRPEEPPTPAASSYTVASGDSLSKIARRFYGNASQWRPIYEANKAVIGANPDLIKPGQVLTIPAIEGASE